jgi:serine-type D-Ala-D-Ala carboxypeptidase/endopeptidase
MNWLGEVSTMNGQRFVLTLLLIAVNCWVGVRSAASQNLTDEWVENAAAPLVENRVVDGLSVGYIEGKHWGIVHLGSSNQAQEKPNNLTVYEIGSVSKVFTGLMLADAVLRGEINPYLAADVANPAGIRLPSRDDRSIKWIELSTHRSGLPRLPDNLSATDLVNPYGKYDSKMAAEFLNQYKLLRQPGDSQEYSNLGASVLGYLVAEKVGKSYEQLLRERIAEPLQMTDCTVSLSDDQSKRLATPHDKFGSTTPPWTFADLPGAGGIHATMRDMMRFAKAQLTPPSGALGEAIELAWQQHTEADESGPATGLGWMIAGDGETRWHNGGTGGFSSSVFINRRINSAVIVLCNTQVTGKVDELGVQLIQKAAGLESNSAPPKLSPFTAVRFEDEKVIVAYDGQTYQWLELNGLKVEDIAASSKKQFGGLWQKRISEDLVEVLWGMGHKPGNMVKLRLVDLKTKQDVVVENAPMTKKNRDAIKENRPQADQAASVEPGDDATAIDAKLRGRLVGRYQLNPNFIFDVQDRDGRLMVGITNQPTNEVFPDSPTRWSYRGIDAALEFKLPKSGPAKSLVLHQNGAAQTAYRITPEPGDTPDPDADQLAVDAKLRRRLVGRYELNPDFVFTVRDRQGRLMVGITNQPTQEVFPDSPTRWSYRGIDAALEFQLPKSGRAKSLVLHQNGAEQTARRIE